jgi:cell division septation protein DedD
MYLYILSFIAFILLFVNTSEQAPQVQLGQWSQLLEAGGSFDLSDPKVLDTLSSIASSLEEPTANIDDRQPLVPDDDVNDADIGDDVDINNVGDVDDNDDDDNIWGILDTGDITSTSIQIATLTSPVQTLTSPDSTETPTPSLTETPTPTLTETPTPTDSTETPTPTDSTETPTPTPTRTPTTQTITTTITATTDSTTQSPIYTPTLSVARPIISASSHTTTITLSHSIGLFMLPLLYQLF